MYIKVAYLPPERIIFPLAAKHLNTKFTVLYNVGHNTGHAVASTVENNISISSVDICSCHYDL